MAYFHIQESDLWIFMMFYGIFSLIMVLVLNIVPAQFEQYWGYGVAGAFYWSVGFLGSAKYMKKITVRDVDDKSLRIHLTAIDVDYTTKINCLGRKSLWRGITIDYTNIKSFKIINSDTICCIPVGADADCCHNNIIYYNINGSCKCCGNIPKSTDMFEIELNEPWEFNYCGECGHASSIIIRVSTDDKNALYEWLKSKKIWDKTEMSDTVALKVNPATGNSYGDLK
eukprot:342397_1